MNYPEIIRKFVDNSLEGREWDEFITIHHRDRSLNALATFCSDVQLLFPADQMGYYCSQKGLVKMLEAARVYEERPDTISDWIKDVESKI